MAIINYCWFLCSIGGSRWLAGHVSHRLAGARAGYRARFSHRLAMPLYWGKAPSHWFQALVWHVQKRGISLGSLLYCNGETRHNWTKRYTHRTRASNSQSKEVIPVTYVHRIDCQISTHLPGVSNNYYKVLCSPWTLYKIEMKRKRDII